MIADVILNGNAHQLKQGSKLRDALIRVSRHHDARVHETDTLEELETVAAQIAERGTLAVALAGGDGSHMAGVSALVRAFEAVGRPLPRVAFVPGGTVGTVAKNVCPLRGSTGEQLLQAVCSGTAFERASLTLAIRDDAGASRVGFIFGAGLVARFFDGYNAAPRQGVATAARLAARAFVGGIVGTPAARHLLSPVACSLEIDGDVRPSKAWSLLLASVVSNLGLGIRATYRAGQAQDRFHVVASTRTPRGLVTQVPNVLAGRAMTGPDHVDALAQSLIVTFDGDGQYVLDGDALRARRITIGAGPVVRVLGLA